MLDAIVSSIPLLHQPSRELSVEEIRGRGAQVERMEHALETAGGIGLAAIQLGIPERLFIVSHPFKAACFNPEILEISSAREEDTEGCLSLGRGKDLYLVSRPTSIRVRYRDSRGKEVTRSLGGLAARVFQHEYDHLDGILICDRGTRAASAD